MKKDFKKKAPPLTDEEALLVQHTTHLHQFSLMGPKRMPESFSDCCVFVSVCVCIALKYCNSNKVF